MRYFFHPEALLEYKESTTFYERRRKGLGRSYIAEVEAVAEDICESPLRFRKASSKSIRKASVKTFPYTLYFREAQDRIEILAVAHDRRKPKYWQNRI